MKLRLNQLKEENQLILKRSSKKYSLFMMNSQKNNIRPVVQKEIDFYKISELGNPNENYYKFINFDLNPNDYNIINKGVMSKLLTDSFMNDINYNGSSDIDNKIDYVIYKLLGYHNYLSYKAGIMSESEYLKLSLTHPKALDVRDFLQFKLNIMTSWIIEEVVKIVFKKQYNVSIINSGDDSDLRIKSGNTIVGSPDLKYKYNNKYNYIELIEDRTGQLYKNGAISIRKNKLKRLIDLSNQSQVSILILCYDTMKLYVWDVDGDIQYKNKYNKIWKKNTDYIELSEFYKNKTFREIYSFDNNNKKTLLK